MKNYVITLSTESDRYKETSKHLQRYISHIPHIGVDGNKVPSKILNGMSPSMYGCYMAHVNMWKKCVNGSDNVCLILEDDARVSVSKDYLHKALDSIEESIEENAEEWDILIIGYSEITYPFLLSIVYYIKCGIGIEKQYDNIIGTLKATKNSGFVGMTAYALSKKGAQKLIDNISVPNGHVDAEMSCFANKSDDFKILILKDRLFFQNTSMKQTLQTKSYIPIRNVFENIKVGDFTLGYILSVLHCFRLNSNSRFYCMSIFQILVLIILIIIATFYTLTQYKVI